jgi:peptidoglycan/LPS O-acetylase OafA/YrhL
MDKKIYFSGLDGLRFISIFFVVLHHLFSFKNYFGLNYYQFPIVGLIGYYGIQFFFAGSGFLITYLLLVEYNRNARISLKYFYVRRILRIWPAYYLLIFLGLVVFLHNTFFYIPDLSDAYLNADYKQANSLYFSFLPHVAGNKFPTAPYVHQTYTIGVEEQFYFIWGLLFFFFAKYTKQLFWAIVFSVLLLSVISLYIIPVSDGGELANFINKASEIIKYSRFSTFAIGALFAYAFFEKKKWVEYFKLPYVQLAVYALLVISIWADISIPFFRDEYISLIMLCVFSISTFKKESLINYDAKWLTFLGRISYGIYLFHIFAIVIAVKICTNIFHFKVNSIWELITLSVITILISILFGFISYFTIERFFLRVKKKFSKIYGKG